MLCPNACLFDLSASTLVLFSLLGVTECHIIMEQIVDQPVVIIPMQPQHIEEVVSIHMQSFPGFFLTFLGPRFLRLLYTEILDIADHIAFVACNNTGHVVGFVAGVAQQSDFYTRLIRRRWLAFGLASLGTVLCRPSIVPRLFRALGYPKVSQTAVTQALLMSIAVAPAIEGHGVGQKLVTHFLMAMKQKNVILVSLTTDRDANERTNRFYQRLGFQLARTYVTPEGRWMNEYVFNLSTWTPIKEMN